MMVGTYGCPMPGPMFAAWESEFVARFQRWTRPFSFGTKMLFVAGLTAAVLMHHSRTAYGKVGDNLSWSGVGPIMVNTSRISTKPLADVCGSIWVVLGSSNAI